MVENQKNRFVQFETVGCQGDVDRKQRLRNKEYYHILILDESKIYIRC